MTTTITLGKAITSHQGELKSLTIREPSARQFVRHGEPFKVNIRADGSPDIEINNKAMFAFISDLSGVDELALEDLSAADFNRARQAVISMVLGTVGAENPSSP